MSLRVRSRCRRSARESIATRSPVSEEDGAALARYYDLDVEDETADLPMYLALASASDGPLLELACGTGRVCVPLAAAGHDVTGVDRDRHVLERAARAWQAAQRPSGTGSAGSLTLVQADIVGLRLERRNDLVILAINTLLLLPGKIARQAVLETMHNHLTPDGRAVIDIPLPTLDDLELYDGRRIVDWSRIDAETGERVSKSTVAQYDPITRRATIDSFFDISRGSNIGERRLHRRDEVNFVSTDELLAEVEAAALQPQSLFGDYSMSEYTPESERLIVIAARSVPRDRADRTSRSDGRSLL